MARIKQTAIMAFVGQGFVGKKGKFVPCRAAFRGRHPGGIDTRILSEV